MTTIDAAHLAAVAGGQYRATYPEFVKDMTPAVAMGPRRPPQTPGVPRFGFESCLTCGAERFAREEAW